MSKSIINLYHTDWVSLYVPEILTDVELDGVSMTTEEALRDYFENKLGLGEVSQVEIFQNKPRSYRPDSISCSIHFKHWYKGAYPLRCKLDADGYGELIGYIDGDRVHHNFKSNHPYVDFTVKIHHTQVPDDIVDTSDVDLTDTSDVLDMFKLLTTHAEAYNMRIEEQRNIIKNQRTIITALMEERESGKKV